MDPIKHAIDAFLLAFPALFSIVNPLSGAFIFRQLTADRPGDRFMLAQRIALYSFLVMLAALWLGSFVLGFFGISLAALRVAGGTVIALTGWDLLSAPERREQRRRDHASEVEHEEIAMFPMTLPITTGPGTIAVAIGLSARHPTLSHGLVGFAFGMSAAAGAMAGVIWFIYRSADGVARMLGERGSQIITRLSAFLLLCIGVQILIDGVQDVLSPNRAGP